MAFIPKIILFNSGNSGRKIMYDLSAGFVGVGGVGGADSQVKQYITVNPTH
jgi:hypothetical protein